MLSLHGPSLRDVTLGLGLGGLLAISPFTPNEWKPSLAIGAAAAAAFVLWRMTVRPDARPQEAERERAFAPVPARVWLALGAVALVFVPTALMLYESWTATVWNNAHGILLPPLMGYLTWSTLRHDPHPEPESSPWGLVLFVGGLLLVAIDGMLLTRYLAVLGLVIVLPGLSLLFLGPRRTRRLKVPLVLGLFMMPVPYATGVHLFLKQTTAAIVAPAIAALGVPVLREDTLLHLPRASFLVADACSGFSALYAAVGLSIVLAASARSWWRRLLLLVAAWPLAIACNVVRVFLLVVVANEFGLGILDTPFHEGSGVATFWGVVLLLFLMADHGSLREAYA